MITYHDKIEQNTPEWFAIREDHPLTGSTSYEFLLARNPATYVLKESNFTGNKYTERGHDLEPVARKLLDRVYDIQTLETGFVTNSDFPWAGCSPDGYTDVYMVEIKCFMKARHLLNAVTTDAKILSQVQWNMMIMGKTKALLVFFCPDNTLEPSEQLIIKEIDANPHIWANMKNRIEVYGAARTNT